MTKKKILRRPPLKPKRQRLTSYERALRDACERLGKAIQEREACVKKLEALAIEIPYLDNIVHALTPPEASDHDRAAAPLMGTLGIGTPSGPSMAEVQAKLEAAQRDIPIAREPTVDQAQFLQRFMPRAGRTTTSIHPAPPPAPPSGTSDDPDEFLKDDGPGRQMLD